MIIRGREFNLATPDEIRAALKGQPMRSEPGYDDGGPNGDKKFEARCAKYGITTQRFWDILRQQDGRCAICKLPSDRTLHIDHDHETGKVRGLLCWRCNVGIGLFQDDPTRLYNAHWYLADPPLDKVK